MQAALALSPAQAEQMKMQKLPYEADWPEQLVLS